MTDALESMRSKIREHAEKPRKKAKATWVPPQPEDFGYGRVIAFDQTLTKTGFAVITHDPGLPMKLEHAGIFRSSLGDETSFEATFLKAEQLESWIKRIMNTWWHFVTTVVHEMPAVQGYRIESSLMAAREIRRQYHVLISHSPDPRCSLEMLQRRSAYKVLTGAADAPKREMTAAVNRLLPDHSHADAWNQDVHDAAGLALYWLWRRRDHDV